jgi:hypothetical protein
MALLSQGMRERDYLQLIPDAEMALVRRLLKRIDRGRGWTPPVAPAQFDAAWNELIMQAASPIGGSWPEQFSTSDLQPARLRQMAALVDKAFLGGVLSKELRRQGVTQLDFVVDEGEPGSCDW